MTQAGALALVLIALSGQTPKVEAPADPTAGDPGCVADLDARIKAIRADAALTEAEQQQRVDAAWNACSGQVRNMIAGGVALSSDLAVRLAIRGAVRGEDRQDTARTDAALAGGLKANARDPENRVTLAIVGAEAVRDE